MDVHARTSRLVILGVAACDSHAVANHLIAHSLRAAGFTVVNLGTCTPVSEFVEAFQQHPHAEAIIIGSLNGHVHEDLRDLRDAKDLRLISCPVIVGGNLSVGAHKDDSSIGLLYDLGVDRVLDTPNRLPDVLDELRRQRVRRHALVAAS